MFAFAHFKNQQSLFGNRQSKPADFVLKLVPFWLARISHTLSLRGGARTVPDKARADFAAGLCGYTLSKAKSSGTQAEWGVASRSGKVYEKCGLARMARV